MLQSTGPMMATHRITLTFSRRRCFQQDFQTSSNTTAEKREKENREHIETRKTASQCRAPGREDVLDRNGQHKGAKNLPTKRPKVMRGSIGSFEQRKPRKNPNRGPMLVLVDMPWATSAMDVINICPFATRALASSVRSVSDCGTCSIRCVSQSTTDIYKMHHPQ